MTKYKLNEKEAWHENYLRNSKNPYELFESEEDFYRELNSCHLLALELEENTDLFGVDKAEKIFENAKEIYLLERKIEIIDTLGGGLNPYDD